MVVGAVHKSLPATTQRQRTSGNTVAAKEAWTATCNNSNSTTTNGRPARASGGEPQSCGGVLGWRLARDGSDGSATNSSSLPPKLMRKNENHKNLLSAQTTDVGQRRATDGKAKLGGVRDVCWPDKMEIQRWVGGLVDGLRKGKIKKLIFFFLFLFLPRFSAS